MQSARVTNPSTDSFSIILPYNYSAVTPLCALKQFVQTQEEVAIMDTFISDLRKQNPQHPTYDASFQPGFTSLFLYRHEHIVSVRTTISNCWPPPPHVFPL